MEQRRIGADWVSRNKGGNWVALGLKFWGKRNLQAVEMTDSNLFMRRLIELQTFAWVLVIAGVLFHGYMGKTWTEVQVFKVDDGWCDTGREGLGQHCFGDFGLAFQGGTRNSVYVEGNPAAMNTPFTALLFRALNPLTYNPALAIYMIVLTLSTLLPFALGSRVKPFGTRMQAATLFGLTTTGTIAALDRGNHVLMLVPLLFGYLLAIHHGRWNSATWLLIVISLLKFWGIVFVVALIARSKYRHAMSAIIRTMILMFVLLMAFGESLTDSGIAMFKAVVNRDYGNTVAPYAFSIQGFIRRLDCLIQSESNCYTADHAKGWAASVYLSVTILIALLIVSFLFIKKSQSTPHIWMLFLVSVGIFGIPEAPVYQLSLLTAAIAAIFVTDNYKIQKEWKWTTRVLLIAVVVTSTPFTLHSNQSIQLAEAELVRPHVFRSDQWLIPLCWLVAIMVGVLEMFKNEYSKAEKTQGCTLVLTKVELEPT